MATHFYRLYKLTSKMILLSSLLILISHFSLALCVCGYVGLVAVLIGDRGGISWCC